MRFALFLGWVVAVSLPAAPAAAQVRTQSAAGVAGSTSSLFGSRSSLGAGASAFGAGAGTGIGGGGGATNQFGAAATNPFVLNQPGGSGGFVGRDNTDTRAIFEALNATNNAFLDQIERRFARRNRGRDSNQAVDARSKIRVTLRLGFAPSSRPVGVATQRLADVIAARGYGGVTVLESSGRVVLRGEVNEEADRRMLARLASLEPGVSSVRNELTVKR